MASIFALEKSKESGFVKVPRSARSRFCDLRNVYYVKCGIIEQYLVINDVELCTCTLFCGDELREEETSDDESAGHSNSPINATLRGSIIVTSHVRSVVGDNKLLLDVKKLYGTYFFHDAVQLLARQISMATPEHLPCNQLHFLQKACKLQSML